jgi:hypothetical protein
VGQTAEPVRADSHRTRVVNAVPGNDAPEKLRRLLRRIGCQSIAFMKALIFQGPGKKVADARIVDAAEDVSSQK